MTEIQTPYGKPEKGNFFKNSQIIILGLCIVLATVIASLILSQAAFKVSKFFKQTITVTGSAQQQIRSDYAVWQCTFYRHAADLPTAYQQLKEDLEKVKAYLIAQKFTEKEMQISPVTTNLVYAKNQEGKDTNKIEEYALNQTIEIRSSDVDSISTVSKQSTELINQNLLFESKDPQYFYTSLDKLKVEMLAKATENAKLRAESMASAGGNHIGFMRSAKMGVFQITPITSTDVSDWGENDTTSIDKKVMAVVNVGFEIK